MRLLHLGGLTILLFFPLLAWAQFGTLDCQFRNERGEPIDVIIELSPAQEHTYTSGPKGHFAIDHLAPGTDTLKAWSQRYRPLVFPFTIQADRVTLLDITLPALPDNELPSINNHGHWHPAPVTPEYMATHVRTRILPLTKAIRGQVRNRRTGEPVRDARVSLRRAKRSTTTGSEGYFFFYPLEPGPDTLLVSGNYMPHFSGSERTFLGFERRSLPVEITADTKLELDVALYERYEEHIEDWHDPVPAVQPQPDKFTVTGRVRDRASGAAIFEALVSCEYRYRDTTGVAHEGCCVLVPTNGSGRYALNNLDPGWYRFGAAFPDYEPVNHELTAPPGSFHEINFDLVKSAEE